MKFSKRLFTKTVALAAICASVATASFATPQGSFDTSEIHVTGQASRSVAPTYATPNSHFYKTSLSTHFPIKYIDFTQSILYNILNLQ